MQELIPRTNCSLLHNCTLQFSCNSIICVFVQSSRFALALQLRVLLLLRCKFRTADWSLTVQELIPQQLCLHASVSKRPHLSFAHVQHTQGDMHALSYMVM